MRFTPGLTYNTEDGSEVRVYAVDSGGTFPIHGAVWVNNEWCVATWTHDGKYMGKGGDSWDLIRPPDFSLRRWVNVYEYAPGEYSTCGLNDEPTRKGERSDAHRACIEILIEGHNGDGLEEVRE